MIRIGDGKVVVEAEIETYYENEVTPIGNLAKVGVLKENRGRKALVIIINVE